MKNSRIDHIGYITRNLDLLSSIFESIGYNKGDVFFDDTQRTKICFMSRDGINERIELVEPYNDNNTMNNMLKKHGEGPYHICYEVDDVFEEYETLLDNDWIPLFKPVSAIAFENRLICYFYKEEAGYLEIVNK